MIKFAYALDHDPTLAAVDAAIEGEVQHMRVYLGGSEIGRECDRRLWYRFRWAAREKFDAKTLYRFADGHASEDIMAARLGKVVSVTEQQAEFSDFGGHLKMHIDGVVSGLLQAPKTPHIWEHKCVNETSFNKLQKLKTLNEKTALQQWNAVYYAQAVLNMHYSGLTRHYLTCATPGTRDVISVRTEANDSFGRLLRAKAERIIFNDSAPPRISETETHYLCRMCPAAAVCFARERAPRSCRTCAHVTTMPDGKWLCELKQQHLSRDAQLAGCENHRHNPDMVGSKPVALDDGAVTYENGYLDRGPHGEDH